VAGTAIHGGLVWRAATLREKRRETATASTLIFDVPEWPGHDAGQHVDVRLRAPDGYTASRSYSIANAPGGDRIELTIEELADGEVSPYLAETLALGNALEMRGPIGGWFVWRPEQREPVQLIAGGSGIVPLMAMLRTRADAGSRAPFRLLYSVRSPQSVIYADELRELAASDETLSIALIYTRVAPAQEGRPAGRIDAAAVTALTIPADRHPACYVCGPTPFVEAASQLLVGAGHDDARIKTERFGPSGS
jgi:ferredoxin-NADP reductase